MADHTSRSRTLNVAFWCTCALGLSTPAWALPGPEVLGPIGLGLAQIGFLLWVMIDKRRVFRGLCWVLGVAFLFEWLGLFGLLAVGLPLVVVARRSRSLALLLAVAIMVLMGELEPSTVVDAPPFLPAQLSDAPRAEPLPESTHPDLQQGGKIVVYLGEPEEYLNQQLNVAASVLRLPDYDERKDELAAAADELLFVHARHIETPEGLSVVQLGEHLAETSYKPPLHSIWKPLMSRSLISKQAPNSPGVFSSEVPAIRPVDADARPSRTLVRFKSTRAIAGQQAPEILLGTFSRDLAVVLNRLGEQGQFPRAFVLAERGPGAVAQRAAWFRVGPVGWGALLLFTAALAAILEHLLRQLRLRALASRMRTGSGPSLLWDAVWAWGPPSAVGAVAGATTFIGLQPVLWPINSPSAFSDFPGLVSALVIALGGLCVLRLRQLPSPIRTISAAVLIAGVAGLLATGALYLGHVVFPATLGIAGLLGVIALPRRGRGWALPQSMRSDMGQKALNLGALQRQSRWAAPGLVVWPARCANPSERLVRVFGPGRYLLRSSTADEDNAYGAYVSVAVPHTEIDEGLAEVLRHYPEGDAGAVLCMPFIDAKTSGVARVDGGGVRVEIGEGHDGITAGRTLSGRAHWSRFTGAGKEADGFDLMSAMRRLAVTPPTVVEWVGAWLVQQTPAPATTDWAGLAIETFGRFDLRPAAWQRVGAEDLPTPCGEETLQFWAATWRRDGALGQAWRWMGLPRFSLPKQVVFPIGGGLYAHEGRWDGLQRQLWLRSMLPGWDPQQRALRVWENVRFEDRDTLVAASIALRLLQSFLPNGPASLGPSPSTRMQQNPEAFPHRSGHDLDPAVPRLGDAIPEPLPKPSCPEHATQADAAILRDWVHDHLCRHIARMHREEHHWSQQRPIGDPPAGRVALGRLHAETVTGHTEAVWVGLPKAVSGVVSNTPGEGRILFLDTPQPASLQDGFSLIITRFGGRLSHGALVCEQRGLTALMGVNRTFRQGDRIEVDASGHITVNPASNDASADAD